MAKTTIVTTPEERVAKQMGVDVEDITSLSLKEISGPMKQAALSFMPSVLRAVIHQALGQSTHECENCGHENQSISPEGGNFQAQKFLLERGADWIPVIKTMNMNFGMDISIPPEVMSATEDIEVNRAVMREIILQLNPTREQLLALYDSVSVELKSAEMIPNEPQQSQTNI